MSIYKGKAVLRGGVAGISTSLLLTVSSFVLLAVFLSTRQSAINFERAVAKNPTGKPMLVKVDQLPSAEDAPMCEWQPASAEEQLVAALQQRQEMRTAAANARQTLNRGDMKPVRTIRDPYAAYSSVAVDPINNEVVLTDENLFQILVYDRLANTPPSAKMTEPKRILAGDHTKIEFQCGLYIDPKNGDIYAVNNDTVDTLVIFDRQQKGDVPPTRELYTPHGTFGIAVDETTELMYLTLQHDSAVVVFHKYATKDTSPLRLIQGDKTRLADPHGIGLDTKNKWMFITNHGAVSSRRPRAPGEVAEGRRGVVKQNWPLEREHAIPGSGKSLPPAITVHDMNATGDVPPLRVITGPKTEMNWPTGVSVDSEKGEVYVANDMGNSILVFNVTDNGDVAPKRKIQGPKTMLGSPTGVWLDTKNKEVWAANFMNHSATVYPMDASGDVAPLRIIRSGPLNEPALGIGNPHPVAYDTKREQILVPN
jgi:DNA-binding beta-propeller fold protein YncE